MMYLVTRPEHDDTTHYLSAFCKQTIDFAEKNGISVVDLHREKAVRREVEGRLTYATLVVFNGHGNEDSVAGYKDEILISVGLNAHLLCGKVVYAISCRSAAVLGRSAKQKGCVSYIGYDDDFVFVYTSELMAHPLQDKTASLFLSPSVRLIDSLLKKNTVGQAVEKCKESLRENLMRTAGADDSSLLRYLWWDLRCMQSLGDQDATIVS